MSSTRPLGGRVALVTGVSRRAGIGASLVRRLLADGASVLATGWDAHDVGMEGGAHVARHDRIAVSCASKLALPPSR